LLRFLLLAILLLLLLRFVYLLARRVAAVVRAGDAARPGAGRSVPLVACRRCGVMVPRPRAVADGADSHLCRSCAGR
jgi:hypothetical protein